MLITKEHLESMVEKYVKEKNNTDKCEGFINGLQAAFDLVHKKMNTESNKPN